ncbi:hypothetical protein GCM10008014_08660 [Paenibacillus silvae]|uniref:Large polyvalent protein-associated domain-containing protein n=1 Tax=Paenibacillus silvae TaxID=1325358 RepID=A0ABQ1Z3C5_9BACL|nr:hypothetical protein [Paenibacillus silvae]GGH46174.1 hypothetical protein GCM10008014_08660 [Paenibacillus silvae]
MAPTIKQLAKQVVKAAKEHGFVVQRYDAYSTQSVYLKLDYGVSNSIRISNHAGKKHLAYRFNLLTDITESYKQQGTHQRNFYCHEDVQLLINDIVRHRQAQIERYGRESYERLMEKNKHANADARGFWQQAKLV